MQRMTKQRQAVLDELQRVRGFRSAQQIFEDLKDQGRQAGLATVYRNVQALAEEHQVDVLRSAEGEALYRLCDDTGHHHHLVCRNCGHAEEIAQDTIEKLVDGIGTAYGFVSVNHSVELFGICANCATEHPELVEETSKGHHH